MRYQTREAGNGNSNALGDLKVLRCPQSHTNHRFFPCHLVPGSWG